MTEKSSEFPVQQAWMITDRDNEKPGFNSEHSSSANPIAIRAKFNKNQAAYYENYRRRVGGGPGLNSDGYNTAQQEAINSR